MEQFARYPEMEITDAVKLLFQSEFGGGHMIANPAKSLEWIQKEWNDSGKDLEQQICEEIGDGMYRISLSALSQGLLPETLNQMFVRTADQTVGKKERFQKKLELLLECCQQGELPLDPEEVKTYLNEYQRQGYPPVSHSMRYREAYHPMYRVVAECYARYYPVFLAIDRKLSEAGDKQVVAAIDGMCGSGKSTLGRILKEIYDCNLFHMDDFFLRPEQRTEERLLEIGGNVDYERFENQVLSHLSDQEGFSYQVFDCGTRTLGEVRQVSYKKLNIIEGAYSQHPYFGDCYDLRFFYGIDEAEQRNRILKRNGAVMLERFVNEWIPMENRYLKAFGIQEKSVLIV